jgi:hypothetical protein
MNLRMALQVAFLALFFTSPAHSQWDILKIADNSTPIPGLKGAFFTYFGVPAIFGDRVAFYGRSGDFHSALQAGIFVWEGGTFQIVADISTPVPQGTAPVSFTRFGDPALSRGRTSFLGQNHFFPLQEGIYVKEGSSLRVVADVNTPIPRGTGNFSSNFGMQALDSGNVAFTHRRPGQHGVYGGIGGQLKMVANLNTPIPGGVGNFSTPSGGLAFDEVSISGSNVAFVGRGAGQEGIYSSIDGSLRVEVNLQTALPGAGGNASSFRGPTIDGENLAFMATGPHFSVQGIYSKIGETLRVVADTQTAIPGKSVKFALLDPFVSLDGGNVVFGGRLAFPSSYSGIFARYSGSLVKIIDTEDILEGKTISSLDFGPQALSGTQVVFKVNFSDFSQAIFLASARR